MSEEYVKLIAQHDETLKLLRALWVDAPVADKPKHSAAFDRALDARVRLMKLRDENKDENILHSLS